MIALLSEANTLTATARLDRLDALPATKVERLQRPHDAILQAAASHNPAWQPPPGSNRWVA